jgi:hypothetical protein
VYLDKYADTGLEPIKPYTFYIKQLDLTTFNYDMACLTDVLNCGVKEI